MLFKNIDGKFIEINKYDYKNDQIYYQKIMDHILHLTKDSKIYL